MIPGQEQTEGIIGKPGVSGVTRMTEAANCAACLGEPYHNRHSCGVDAEQERVEARVSK